MSRQTQIDFSVHVNSLSVFKEKVLPELSGRRLDVYNAIKALGGSATSWEVGQYLNKPLNHISGRPGELKKMGWIEDTGLSKEHNGNKFTIYRILK